MKNQLVTRQASVELLEKKMNKNIQKNFIWVLDSKIEIWCIKYSKVTEEFKCLSTEIYNTSRQTEGSKEKRDRK